MKKIFFCLSLSTHIITEENSYKLYKYWLYNKDGELLTPKFYEYISFTSDNKIKAQNDKIEMVELRVQGNKVIEVQ